VISELAVAGKLLALILIANGAPLFANRLLGERGAWPIDGGLRFIDGRPLLGRGKTWRGLGAGVLACAVTAPLLGLSVALGVVVGATAMLGDALASCIKRRLGIPSGGHALGLDQVPEALLPLLACRVFIDIGAGWILVITLVFAVSVLLISRVLFALGVRDTPY
jgi:CDP-diglyceride synthetase